MNWFEDQKKAEELFKLVKDFQNYEIWKKLEKAEYLAVKSEKQLIYLRVYDLGPGRGVLCIYPDAQAFSKIENLLKESKFEIINFQNRASQEMLQVSLDPEELTFDEIVNISETSDLYPNLIRYHSYYYPNLIKDDNEFETVLTALRAINEVSSKLETTDKQTLGFKELLPGMKAKIPQLTLKKDGNFLWESTPLPNEPVKEEIIEVKLNEKLTKTVKKLSKLKPKAEFYVKLEYLPSYVVIDNDKSVAPVYLFLMQYLDNFVDAVVKSFVNLPTIGEYREEELVNFLNQLGEIFIQNKFKPESLIVTDKRTYYFFKDFCQQAGIKLIDQTKKEKEILKYLRYDEFLNLFELMDPFLIEGGEKLFLPFDPEVEKQAKELILKGYYSETDEEKEKYKNELNNLIEKHPFYDYFITNGYEVSRIIIDDARKNFS